MENLIKEEGGFRYLEAGEGQPIVILHGLFGTWKNFRFMIDHFAVDHRVILPFLPLYTLPLKNASVKYLTEYIDKFLKHKKIKEAAILGHSLGGHIALQFAITYPQKTQFLILTGSSGLYENTLGGTYPRKEDYEFIKGKVEYTFYKPESASKEVIDEVFTVVNDRSKAMRILYIAKSTIQENMAKHLCEITSKTCLVWGREDKITPPRVAEEFQSLIRNSELYWIDECGHVPMLEQPDQFNSIIRGWLEKNLAGKQG
jgi:pimeloyl-ACP methyl ester carboxylesterase